MIVGNIKTKDILIHPITMLTSFGIFKYIFFLSKALSSKKFRFIDFF